MIFVFLGDLPKGKLEVFSTKDQDFSNLPDVGKMYLTEVTSLISPIHFYVRFPFGIEPIDDIKKRGIFLNAIELKIWQNNNVANPSSLKPVYFHHTWEIDFCQQHTFITLEGVVVPWCNPLTLQPE